MRYAVSSDMAHPLVDAVVAQLSKAGHTVTRFAPLEGEANADWPLVTLDAAKRVACGEADEAVVLCWTGTGASIVANKVPGIRAALCCDAETARGARKWNHANVLALSLRATSLAVAQEILEAWMKEPWTEDAWNKEQVGRIADLDQRRA